MNKKQSGEKIYSTPKISVVGIEACGCIAQSFGEEGYAGKLIYDDKENDFTF